MRWTVPITGHVNIKWIYDTKSCGNGRKAVFHNNRRIWELNAPTGTYMLNSIPVKAGDTFDFTVWGGTSNGTITH
jgi:hypothetical protein